MPAIISGTVFDDLNHNGVLNVGEPGVPNVFVVLELPNGTCTMTQTAGNGTYSFTNLTIAGAYTIYETVGDPGATCPPTTFTQPSGFNGSTTSRKINLTVSTTQINNNATLGNNNFGHDNLEAFGCTPFAWQGAFVPTQLFRIDLQLGTSTNQGTLSPSQQVNAIGYNPTDGNIYGYNLDTDRVSRITADGTLTSLPAVPNLPTNVNYNVGDVDENGYLYLSSNNNARFYVIDVNPDRETYGRLVDPANGFQEQTTSPFGVALSSSANIADWAFNPSDGFIYAIQNNNGIVTRIDPVTGTRTNLTTNTALAAPFGAVFFDRNNNLYGIDNNTGRIYRYAISGNTATRTLFSTTAASGSNDGARCPTAPITFAFFDPTLKSTEQTEVGVGDTITYTITLDNVGNTTADNVILTDTIPGGTSFINGSLVVNGAPVVGNPDPPGVNIGDLGRGVSTITFSVVVDTIPSPNPTENIASLAYTFFDPDSNLDFDSGNNTNTVSTTVNFAIVHMVKSVDRDLADIGDTLTYTIVLTNTGNTTSNNLVFIDTIPNDTTFITNSLTQDGVVIPGGNPNPPGASLPNSIGAGATSTITFQVTIDSIPSPNPIPNNSSLTFDHIGDPSIPTTKSGNSNSNTVNTQVNHATLENITKSVDKDFADCGDTLTYTIIVPNDGNVTAQSVIYTDTIPNDTIFVVDSVTVNGVTQPGVNPQSGVDLGDIGAGSVSTLTFQVIVDCT